MTCWLWERTSGDEVHSHYAATELVDYNFGTDAACPNDQRMLTQATTGRPSVVRRTSIPALAGVRMTCFRAGLRTMYVLWTSRFNTSIRLVRRPKSAVFRMF